MSCRKLAFTFLLTLCVATTAWAQNEGQDDLDKATELQLRVQSLRDTEQVIKLSESALKKGLDEDNAKFAKQLLVSSLWQHASEIAKAMFENPQPNARWNQIRRVVLADLEKLLMHDPKFADAHILLARLNALPGGDVEKSRKSVDTAIELYKDDKSKRSDAIVLRAQLQTDADKQLADLSEAIDTDPTNVKAWQARAVHFIGRGELDKAIPDFERILERDAGNITIRQALIEALSNLEKYDLAMTHADKAIELQPQVADSYLLRARIHELKDDYDKALTDLDEAVKIQADHPVALFTRARLHMLKDEFAKAREDLDRFLQVRPGSPQGILLRSMLSSQEGRNQDAIADIQLLLRSDPRNAELRMQLGAIYVADQRPRKAIDVFTELIEEDANNWSAHRARGDALLSVGKHKEAISDYEVGLKIKPDDQGILNNLAWVLATSTVDELRDGKRSIELGTKACEVTKYEMPHILSTLAAGYAESGDFENAIKWSTKAVELGREKLKEQIEQLEKELESYKEKKPWRELQKIEDKPDPPRKVIDT